MRVLVLACQRRFPLFAIYISADERKARDMRDVAFGSKKDVH